MMISHKGHQVLILLACLFLTSCISADDPTASDISLIGYWQHTERAYSIGAGLIVEDVIRGEIYEIRKDGTFTHESGGLVSGTWEITPDNVLKFIFKEEVEDRVINLNYEINNDNLILSPALVICTDGCYDKYERR